VTATQLQLAHDFEPAITRSPAPPPFAYWDRDGTRIDEASELARIRSLSIPPGWKDVWIAVDPTSHLQATGIDSKGRKQYRYHPEWRHDRDELKFSDMEAFGRIQPRLRQHIAKQLTADDGLSHGRVLALALRLLDIGLFRVGSDRYAHDNRHYGLTTLLTEQVAIRRGRAIFDYIGKAGRRQRLAIADPEAVAALESLRRRRAGPEELLVYKAAGGWKRVHREDVNNFLRVEAGGPFSAKEYRTWNGTVVAAVALAAERPRRSRAARVAADATAAALGNTPAVARQSYIDPRVLELYASGEVIELDELPNEGWEARARVESAVLKLLGGSGGS
jgi:DNA topoisomerase I